MPLILGPSGNSLLLGPIGLPATSTNCCCCKEGEDCPHCPCCVCIQCGDDVQYSLPIDGCHNASGKACLTVTLSGLTFVTNCRTFRGNDCVAAPGTWASYKYLAAVMPDLVLPFNWNDGVHTSIRDPDSPCNTINPDTVCCQWRTCTILADTGIDATQYSNANCTGTANTFSVLILTAVLNYQVVGTTRRFILWVTASPSGTIPIPIFFGVVNFDARRCANYSTWPLVMSNGLSTTSCICGGSGTAMHPAATGGTATITMACDTDCSGFDSESWLASVETSGPQIAAHRMVDASAVDLADAREERSYRCRQCNGRRNSERSAL